MRKAKVDVKEFVLDGNPKPTNNMEGKWKFRVDNNTFITANGFYKEVVDKLKTKYTMIVLDTSSVITKVHESPFVQTNVVKKDICSFF